MRAAAQAGFADASSADHLPPGALTMMAKTGGPGCDMRSAQDGLPRFLVPELATEADDGPAGDSPKSQHGDSSELAAILGVWTVWCNPEAEGNTLSQICQGSCSCPALLSTDVFFLRASWALVCPWRSLCLLHWRNQFFKKYRTMKL